MNGRSLVAPFSQTPAHPTVGCLVMIFLLSGFSKALAPAWVLTLVILLAAIKAGLGVAGAAFLVAGVVGIPGISHKRFPALARTLGLQRHWRNRIVLALTLLAAAVCALLDVPAPVPATVLGLAAGNAALAVARRWLNASAHVSVATFGVLWVVETFGSSFAWLLVLVPLMLASRVGLREHTWSEGVFGLLIGAMASGCFLVAGQGLPALTAGVA